MEHATPRTHNLSGPKIIAAVMQKGGVAKTTTIRGMASALTEEGERAVLPSPARVLAVDLDPQSNLTQAFIGTECTAQLERGMYNVLVEKVPLSEILIHLPNHIDLAPSTTRMALTENAIINERRREDRLKKSLEPLLDQYDFILVDCPPNLGLLTVNALSAADSVFVPVSTDFYSLASLPFTMDIIGDIKKDINPHLALLGVVVTNHNPRTLMDRQALDKLTHDLQVAGIPMFATIFHTRIKYRESQAMQQGVTDYAPDSEEAAVLRDFVKEVLNGR
jgi:chromosome partitioning protein